MCFWRDATAVFLIYGENEIDFGPLSAPLTPEDLFALEESRDRHK